MLEGEQLTVVITTSVCTLIGGFLLGAYATQGYIIPPELAEERRRNYEDPVESGESDIDEDDTVLDHAPNWANGAQADRRQGLSNKFNNESRIGSGGSGGIKDNGEECKLVLVVRTDLGMTKGKSLRNCHCPRSLFNY
jgi:PTH2 family peptidyl-tRNA hydrolase